MSNNEFRPTTFADYSGQEETKEYLKLKVEAFKKTGKASGHVLFLGPSGLGKTTIANVYSKELGVGFHQLMATRIQSFSDITNLLSTVKENDIVFIDEMHALNSRMQEELYGVMEDFAYDEYDSYFDKNIRVSLPKFTLIGATTHAGNLNTPLLSRFQDRIELSPYSQVQLVDMIAKAAQRMYSVELPNDIAIMMAKLSRKTARHAYSLLNSYMEVVEAMTPGSVRSSDLTSDILLKALRLKRLDPVLGLDVASRKYLVTMLRERSPLGAKSLATMINEQEATITNMIEPFLFSDIEFAIGDETFYGAMARPSRKGRMATEIAEAYIKACQDMQRQEGWFSNESLSF